MLFKINIGAIFWLMSMGTETGWAHKSKQSQKEISVHEVKSAICKMKNDKSAGPTGVVAEMLKASGESGVRWMTDLFNVVVKTGKVPEDWSKSWMVSIYKGKGDALECNSYRGIKLL